MSEFNYELFAIRYATRDARCGDHFIGGDPMTGRCRWIISSGWQGAAAEPS